jgi:Zn-dependent peptidase ImmA (M78 family)
VIVDLSEEEVIRRNQISAPVDVTRIAEALGIKVWESALPNGISGKLVRDSCNGGRSGFSIIVHSSEAFVRRRFTVAHEIAHFVLHRNKITNELADDALYRSGLPTREEAQANRLAADILMPRHLIARESSFGSDPAYLAKRFHVSEPAMRIRLGLTL